MKTVLCCFASARYWTNSEELENAVKSIQNEMKELCDEVILVDDNFELNNLEKHKEDLMIAMPMSGGVQPNIIKATEYFSNVLIYAGYVKGNFDNEIGRKMIIGNAAPAVMDVYAVLKRKGNVHLCSNRDDLKKRINAYQACDKIRGSKLLAIGSTEPWVISAVRDWSIVKERFGIEIINVSQEELIEIYENTNSYYAEGFYKQWREKSKDVIEPTESDLLNASKFQTALINLIEKYGASGAAVACFNMLKTGTTSCLGVSYINTYTDYVVSCEGDMDSAITMLIMKALAKDSTWMANPNIQPDNTVNFVHCTAPTCINGKECEYILRNHHESGIGVSTQVQLPLNVNMTACRISDNLSKMLVQNCISTNGEYEPSCRTQLKVQFESFEKYINDCLGCHLIFAFNDIKQELIYVAENFGITVL